MSNFQNSYICKAVLMLLTGYFLLSSLNLNVDTPVFRKSRDVHSMEYAWKKIVKALKVCSEIEKCSDKEGKTAEPNISLDYLIPLDVHLLASSYSETGASEKSRHFAFNPQEFHSKIPLPPPEFT